MPAATHDIYIPKRLKLGTLILKGFTTFSHEETRQKVTPGGDLAVRVAKRYVISIEEKMTVETEDIKAAINLPTGPVPFEAIGCRALIGDSFGAKLNWKTKVAVMAGAWATATAYLEDAYVAAGGKVYICTTAGTSAASGSGPTGTTAGITDGTAVWDYVSPDTDPAIPAGTVEIDSVSEGMNKQGNQTLRIALDVNSPDGLTSGLVKTAVA